MIDPSVILYNHCKGCLRYRFR